MLTAVIYGKLLQGCVYNRIFENKVLFLFLGKVTTPANNGTIGRAAGANAVNTANASMTNGLGLGGLFAGGMPKLRATGIQLGERHISVAVGNVPDDYSYIYCL